MSSSLHPVWRDYRARCRSLVAVLASVPVLCASVSSLRSATGVGTAAALLISAWATSLVGATIWFARFRCPFCSERFHWTWLVANPLSSECLHCGFKKWRDPDAGREYGCR